MIGLKYVICISWEPWFLDPAFSCIFLLFVSWILYLEIAGATRVVLAVGLYCECISCFYASRLHRCGMAILCVIVLAVLAYPF
jgi:hypothetical protein